MFVIAHRRIFYVITAVLTAASIGALMLWGLRPGIDFKGGALLEVVYPDGRPEKAEVEKALQPLDIEASVRPTESDGFIIRMRDLTDTEQDAVRAAVSLGGKAKAVEERFDSIGPLLGKEAVHKSLVAIGLVILCIVIFITFAFRKVSLPVASWKYGIITIIALIHDVLVPAGLFAYLGYFRGIEVDTLFVTALLVVLGFSVHDTIVVFDRVRENLRVSAELRDKKSFDTIVGESINQTVVRSLNTSLTTLFAVVVLYLMGPESTKMFSLALSVGIIAGTYSSIFLASPLLVTAEKLQSKA